jgi:hypothetical protein
MFIWNTSTGMVADFFSGQPYQSQKGMARPIASNMVAGFVKGNSKIISHVALECFP